MRGECLPFEHPPGCMAYRQQPDSIDSNDPVRGAHREKRYGVAIRLLAAALLAVMHQSSGGGGPHAEDSAQAAHPGQPMSEPMGWKVNPDTGQVEWQPIPVCVECQAKYPPSLFPPDTPYEPGGPWEE